MDPHRPPPYKAASYLSLHDQRQLHYCLYTPFVLSVPASSPSPFLSPPLPPSLKLAMSKLVEKTKHFVADKVAHIEKPDADLTWVSIKGMDRKALSLETDVLVTNPYSHDLPICEVSYRLRSGDRDIASGTIPDPGSIRANDKTAIKIPTVVPYDFLLSILRDIGADWDLDYDMEVKLTVDIPIFGNFSIPLGKKGTLKLPTLSDIF